jgi:hypothetical protein
MEKCVSAVTNNQQTRSKVGAQMFFLKSTSRKSENFLGSIRNHKSANLSGIRVRNFKSANFKSANFLGEPIRKVHVPPQDSLKVGRKFVGGLRFANLICGPRISTNNARQTTT